MPVHDSIPTDGPYEDDDEYEEERDDEAEDGEGHAADEISFRDTKSDLILSSQVVAVLSELGHYNRVTNTYQLNNNDANSCLRDLIRFLRNDGTNFLVRRQMGISNIVNNDLLPIVEQHTVNVDTGAITEAGKSIMDKTIRLLVDLTNPTMLHYKNQQVPKEDKHEAKIYLELQESLFRYKVSFAMHKRFWIVLSKHLTRIIALDESERQVEDGLLFERIIVLIRNVLHIPIVDSSTLIDDDVTVQDRIIEQLHQSNVLDILQFMIQGDEHRDFCFHLVEIIYLMLREQNAEFLAKSVDGDPLASKHLDSFTREQLLASSGRSQYEREYDRREIDEIRERDRQKSADVMAMAKAKMGTSRLARPTYVVKNMKSISEHDMICHQPFMNPEVEIDFNKNKSAKMRPRNHRPMQDNMDNSDALGVQRIHRSNRKLRLILHQFCDKFLSECYNDFMQTLRSNLSRGSAQDNDETYYLWAMQFFMEFNRCRPKASAEERYRHVYQTLATSTFHYLQTLVDNYTDHLAQKKLFKLELGDWAKRLHCALRSYREMLFSISAIERLNLPEALKMCHRIKQDIFTEPDYRELLLKLLLTYNEERMSKAYLRDLIETNHIFLKMLEYHAKISYDFKIKVKSRKRKSKKNAKKGENSENGNSNETAEPEVSVNPEELWVELLDEVSKTLNAEKLSEESVIGTFEELRELFDPLTGANIEDQKLGSMRRICSLLRAKQVEQAVRLFRETRNVLSGLDDENTFGEFDILPEDELLALNAIMMTDFPEEEKASAGVTEVDENGGNEEEEEGEEEDSVHVKEATFTIEDTVKKYAHPNVLKAYRLILKNFRANSILTNHSIVRMLHRIAVDLKMPPMFYNFGFFLVFEKILSDPVLKLKPLAESTSTETRAEKSHKSVIKELGAFAHFITRNFFKLLAKFPIIASELCFCANTRDAYSMELGWVEVKQEKTRKKRKIENVDDDELEESVPSFTEQFDEEEEKEEEQSISQSKKKRRKIFDGEQEESAPTSAENIDEEEGEESTVQIKKKRIMVFDDEQIESAVLTSLENINEEVEDNEQSIVQVKKKRMLIFDGEEEESTLASQENIDENVEEKEQSISQVKRKRVMVFDDEEEESTPTSMKNIDGEVEEESISETKEKRMTIFDSEQEESGAFFKENVEEEEEESFVQIKKKRIMVFDDEQMESVAPTLENVDEEVEEKEPSIAQVKKKRKLILDDDDDE